MTSAKEESATVARKSFLRKKELPQEELELEKVRGQGLKMQAVRCRQQKF